MVIKGFLAINIMPDGTTPKGLKYSDIVGYDKLDPFKEKAMERAAATFGYTDRLGIRLLRESVGLTAAVFELDDMPCAYIAFGVEGLGTKNMVAEAMAEKEKIGKGVGIERRNLFAGIGKDNMAMALNDLGAVGAMPVAFSPIHASGDSGYFTDEDAVQGLLDGYDTGARAAGVAIPGGETPTLKGIVYQNTLDIAGGAWGIIRPKDRLVLGHGMEPGLTIYGLGSSGIHSNGLSLARRIVENMANGYFHNLSSGLIFGRALLKPTFIYTAIVEYLFDAGVDIRGMQPITGHGWAKIMRCRKQLRYVIDFVPEPQEEFVLMQEKGPVTDEEAYKTWNMGVGYVVFAPDKDSAKIKNVSREFGFEAYEMGHVVPGEREVVIAPKNIVYRPR